jgi:hypothetical protein
MTACIRGGGMRRVSSMTEPDHHAGVSFLHGRKCAPHSGCYRAYCLTGASEFHSVGQAQLHGTQVALADVVRFGRRCSFLSYPPLVPSIVACISPLRGPKALGAAPRSPCTPAWSIRISSAARSQALHSPGGGPGAISPANDPAVGHATAAWNAAVRFAMSGSNAARG